MGATIGKSGSNFLDALPSQSTLHVVMLGLDSAGKTTALYRLKFDQYLNTVPTIGFNCEKVQGTMGKAKGVNFLIWDVGGQEKLRPLWRSYTRCTDGILFVIDSVDVERMEEAKMELMRTTKCPDNQGVPVLILANKQDLPGAKEPKELEKLLGLHEFIYPTVNLKLMTSNSSSTGNIVSCSNTNSAPRSYTAYNLTPTSQHNKLVGGSQSTDITTQTMSSSSRHGFSSTSSIDNFSQSATFSHKAEDLAKGSSASLKKRDSSRETNTPHGYIGWYIQPACAITGDGLQEGLEVLYEMIINRRKFNKNQKKKR